VNDGSIKLDWWMRHDWVFRRSFNTRNGMRRFWRQIRNRIGRRQPKLHSGCVRGVARRYDTGFCRNTLSAMGVKLLS